MSNRDETFNGYGDAQKVDELIGEILNKYGINSENAKQWMIFTRTIGTSLKLIDAGVDRCD